MSLFEMLKAMYTAYTPEVKEYTLRAQRDVRHMLEDFSPQEGEDYGPWKPQVTRLLQAFEQGGSWGAQQELARMLHDRDAGVSVLLDEAVASDGRPWKEVWEEIEEEIEKRKAQERRAAKERRMRERLARTTGDSMADEIMAMLREQELSRTDIYRRYSRNVTAQSINDALFVLERLGWARWKTVSTGGRGREVWYLPSEE